MTPHDTPPTPPTPPSALRIPILVANGEQDDPHAPAFLRVPQPILQFKEFEVDEARYTVWQAYCRAARERERASRIK